MNGAIQSYLVLSIDRHLLWSWRSRLLEIRCVAGGGFGCNLIILKVDFLINFISSEIEITL